MKVGSLFAGVGGFDLAAKWVGWETAWFSEIDPYASAVLQKHWPGVPNHGDITKVDFSKVEPVDVLCGGFPCQDISTAGKGEGIDGERSGLWREYARAIGELRPRYVVVENVAALLGRGMERVLGDLAALGYDAEWHCIPASAVGAPHRRDRLWIVAYPHGDGCDAGRRENRGAPTRLGQPDSEGGAQFGVEPGGSTVAHAEKSRTSRRLRIEIDDSGDGGLRVGESVGGRGDGRDALGVSPDVADSKRQRGRGGENHRQDAADVDAPGEGIRPRGHGGWWAVEPDVGRVANGIPARVDRLRGLGNAIVPQVAEVLFRAIQEREA